MKLIHLIAPLVAMATGGVWLGSQSRDLRLTRESNETLRQRIEAARTSLGTGPAESSLTRRSIRDQGESETGAIAWKEIANRFQAARGQSGLNSLRENLWLRQRVSKMTTAELLAALDEVAALDVSSDVRGDLENMLIDALARKDPALVLERFADQLSDPEGGRSRWQLGAAFQKWTSTDPAAATAWLDAAVAAGKLDSKSLDGKNPLRASFEASLLALLAASDPAAAGLRIDALPANQRREVFEQAYGSLKPGTEKAFASVAREHLPETEHAQMLNRASSMMFQQGGFERVGRFLDQIDAPPAERALAAGQAATEHAKALASGNNLNRGDIDTMREWLGQQAPDRVDAITGQALAAVPRNRFDQAAAILTELHADSGHDELLVSFLKGPLTTANPQASLDLANRISNPALRAETIARLQSPAPP